MGRDGANLLTTPNPSLSSNIQGDFVNSDHLPVDIRPAAAELPPAAAEQHRGATDTESRGAAPSGVFFIAPGPLDDADFDQDEAASAPDAAAAGMMADVEFTRVLDAFFFLAGVGMAGTVGDARDAMFQEEEAPHLHQRSR
jgi:hypothetical protein